MIVSGTINKLQPGDKAVFTGEMGRFWIRHPALCDVIYGVYEVTIEPVGVRPAASDGYIMELGSAPIIGKCVFVRGG